MITMPQDANIPYEWQVGNESGRKVIVVPSWSRTDKDSYAIIIDGITGEMTCECKGFQIRKDCHHVRGAKWFCSQPNFRRKGVQATSLEAYFSMTNETMGEHQRLVFSAIERLEPISDKQIAMVLGWPINTITPRRGELHDMGRIRCVGDQVDHMTNRREMFWETVK